MIILQYPSLKMGQSWPQFGTFCPFLRHNSIKNFCLAYELGAAEVQVHWARQLLQSLCLSRSLFYQVTMRFGLIPQIAIVLLNKKWTIRVVSVFFKQTSIQFLTQINVKNMSPPLTTCPGLPPYKLHYFNARIFLRKLRPSFRSLGISLFEDRRKTKFKLFA